MYNENNSHYWKKMIERKPPLSLIEAPHDQPLRIRDIQGPEGMRRRLLSLGLRVGDLVEVGSQAMFGGPLLIKDRAKGTCVALGRGIARRIKVDVIDGHE